MVLTEVLVVMEGVVMCDDRVVGVEGLSVVVAWLVR